MQVFFGLLFVVMTQHLCYGTTRLTLFGPLHIRTRRMATYKELTDFPNLADDEKREVYNYEQTIVVKVAGPTNRVHYCEVIEAYKQGEDAVVSKVLESKLKLKVQKVDMERIMSLLADCDSVDEWDIEEESDEDSSEKPESSTAVTNGIFPGTKWCGLGDIASGFHDLGQLHDVDRCCRSHDSCPIKVLSKDTRYNLTNDATYTKSHCICDKAFYYCLKADNGWSAGVIGNLYFYAAAPQCIKGIPGKFGEKVEFVPAPYEW